MLNNFLQKKDKKEKMFRYVFLKNTKNRSVKDFQWMFRGKHYHKIIFLDINNLLVFAKQITYLFGERNQKKERCGRKIVYSIGKARNVWRSCTTYGSNRLPIVVQGFACRLLYMLSILRAATMLKCPNWPPILWALYSHPQKVTASTPTSSISSHSHCLLGVDPIFRHHTLCLWSKGANKRRTMMSTRGSSGARMIKQDTTVPARTHSDAIRTSRVGPSGWPR